MPWGAFTLLSCLLCVSMRCRRSMRLAMPCSRLSMVWCCGSCPLKLFLRLRSASRTSCRSLVCPKHPSSGQPRLLPPQLPSLNRIREFQDVWLHPLRCTYPSVGCGGCSFSCWLQKAIALGIVTAVSHHLGRGKCECQDLPRNPHLWTSK